MSMSNHCPATSLIKQETSVTAQGKDHDIDKSISEKSLNNDNPQQAAQVNSREREGLTCRVLHFNPQNAPCQQNCQEGNQDGRLAPRR